MKSAPWQPMLISLALGAVIVGETACSPKIYLVDRQTVMEDEAAAEWPEFEKDLLNKSEAQGPTPFAKTAVNAHRSRLYKVLNGELASEPAAEPGKSSR